MNVFFLFLTIYTKTVTKGDKLTFDVLELKKEKNAKRFQKRIFNKMKIKPALK